MLETQLFCNVLLISIRRCLVFVLWIDVIKYLNLLRFLQDYFPCLSRFLEYIAACITHRDFMVDCHPTLGQSSINFN